MKKYLSILFLIAFIVPSVALASWWNPLSWKVFNFLQKKDTIPQAQVINTNPTNEPINSPTREIEKLQTQINELKKQQSAPIPIKTTPIVKEVNTTIVPITPTLPVVKKNYDQQLSQLVAEMKKSTTKFEGVIKDTEEFTSTVRATMNKYPSESILQQSGQELLNENNNLASISKKLVASNTEGITKISSYFGLGILPPSNELSQITQQYNDYYKQYEVSKNKMSSLINSFATNEKTVLDRLTLEAKQKLENLKNSQSSSPTQTYNTQIESAFSTLQTTLSYEENRQTSMATMKLREEKVVQDWMKQNPSVFSSSTYITRFNAILASHGLYYMMIQ